jgi:signal peptidase I
MVEKTIQWFRNNWFLWVILILAYITIRIFGYDVKVVESRDNTVFAKKGELDDL